jgi:glycosyltransferase involved in cell wall biosynthesis
MDVPVYRTESPPSVTWLQETLAAPVKCEGSGPRRLWRALRNLWQTRRVVGAHGAIVFTDDMPVTANLFGLLARAGSRPTIVRTDPYFHAPARSSRRRFLRACFAAVDRLIVWAPTTAERYHRCLGIPHERMTAVHFHHTLSGYSLDPPAAGDYVFSGGDSMRDYPTLLDAVRGLPIRVRIATRWLPPADVQVPDNVVLGPTSPAAFRSLLAGARLVVLPLRNDSLRTSGQQSYLNAMALARPVIVTDPDDASYYIDDQRTGRLVPSADPVALGDAIRQLLDSPEQARTMGERAQEFALPLDAERTWTRILAIARATHRDRQAESYARTPMIA